MHLFFVCANFCIQYVITQVYEDVMLMGFDLEVELVCRLIVISRGVVNAVLMGVQ